MSVQQYLSASAQALVPRGRLTEQPAGDLGEGAYVLNSSGGPFALFLPPATGSQARCVFHNEDTQVHAVTLQCRNAGDAINGEVGLVLVLDTNDECFIAFDQSPGHYVVHPYGAVGSTVRQVVAVPVTDITLVSGSIVVLYTGPAQSGRVLLNSFEYYDDATHRYLTLAMELWEDASFVLDLGTTALPVGSVIESVQAHLTDFAGGDGVPAPAVSTVNDRQLRINRLDAYDGNTPARIHLLVRNPADEGPLSFLPGHVETQHLNYATFTLSTTYSAPASVPDDIDHWQLATRNFGSALTTDGTTFTGFEAGAAYAVTYGLRPTGGVSGVFVARRSSDGQVLAGSATTVDHNGSSAAQGSSESKTFIFVPRGDGDGFTLGPSSSLVGAVADSSFCTIVQTTQSQQVGWGDNGDWTYRGRLTTTASGELSPGLYVLDSATGPLTVRLPPATGSQRQFVFLTQDVESQSVTLEVQAGEHLFGVLDGMQSVTQNRTMVVCVDVSPQNFVTYTLMADVPVAAGGFARFNATAGEFQESAVGGSIVLQSIQRVVATTDVTLTDVDQALSELLVSLEVEAGDVIQVFVTLGLRITSAVGGGHYVSFRVRRDALPFGPETRFSLVDEREGTLQAVATMPAETAAVTRLISVHGLKTTTSGTVVVDGSRSALLVRVWRPF